MSDLAFSEQEVEAARKVFSGPCEFMLGVAGLDQLPNADLPEVAFAGRSNVGKSSLLNAMTGRKTLARTSHTPGRTQQLNFFKLGEQIYMVDMPGYGYARVSKTQKSAWNRLIRDYLCGRPNLRCVFVLVDARHGLKESDREIMTLMDEAAVAYRVVFTKGDKAKKADRKKLDEAVCAELKKYTAAFPATLYTSAREQEGLETLKATVLSVAVRQH